MPLAKPKRKSQSSEVREKDYKKIGSIWEKKDYPGQYNVSVDDFHGQLIWKQVVVDKEAGMQCERYYKLKYVSMFEPRTFDGQAPPEALRYNLTIDLLNTKATELVGETEWVPIAQASDDDQESSEEDEG